MRGNAYSKIASMNVECLNTKIEHLANYLPIVVCQVGNKSSGGFTPLLLRFGGSQDSCKRPVYSPIGKGGCNIPLSLN